MDKQHTNVKQLVQLIKPGHTILVGGFGLSGMPETLIKALYEQQTCALTVVSNNCGTDEYGLGLLLKNKQIHKMIASYVGENKRFEQQLLNREIEVELCPQGTLAERLRAGGAGIPAFYTATGVGTPIAEGKDVRHFNGKAYVLEHAITGDIAFVKAWKADRAGNLLFRKTARNFNPLVAKAAAITIVEAEEIVEIGAIDPDAVHVPGIYVHYIVQSTQTNKIIEKRTVLEDVQ